MLNPEELIHYQRHVSLPEIGVEGQEKLKQSSVLVIGAGGLGCPVLHYLTAAGVGRITVVDFDVVEASNLQRQTLFHGAWQHDFANQQPNNFFNQGNWPSKHTCLEQKEGTPEI